MRKLKPFNDFNSLASDRLASVHDRLVNSTLHKTMAFLRDQCGIAITYGRLQRYYHRWQTALQIKEQCGVAVSVNEFIAIQNGESVPLAPIAHHLILKSACIQAGTGENSAAELLTLQRVANNQFNQDIAKAKHELEQRRQNLRAQELALKQTNVAPAPAPASIPEPANVVPLPPPSESELPSNSSDRSHPSEPSNPFLPPASPRENPVSFEPPTLTEGPYIRDYPQISSFENQPSQSEAANEQPTTHRPDSFSGTHPLLSIAHRLSPIPDRHATATDHQQPTATIATPIAIATAN